MENGQTLARLLENGKIRFTLEQRELDRWILLLILMWFIKKIMKKYSLTVEKSSFADLEIFALRSEQILKIPGHRQFLRKPHSK